MKKVQDVGLSQKGAGMWDQVSPPPPLLFLQTLLHGWLAYWLTHCAAPSDGCCKRRLFSLLLQVKDSYMYKCTFTSTPFSKFVFYFLRINKEITVVGRNPSSSDIFLDSNKNKVMISRLHARIISEKDATGKHTFKISDTSLNGTYINDIKISDSCDLNPGDTVTFGHLKGAVLPPGVFAQQPDSEFRFKVSSLFEYIHFKLRVHSHDMR